MKLKKLIAPSTEFCYYSKLAIILYIFIVACYYKLWFASVIPTGVSQIRPHDGTLFYNLAVSLFHGQWLGEYNQYTLIKGAGLPAFLALCAQLGFNPIVLCHILYLVACLVFYKAMRVLKFNNLICLLGFLMLAFNPVTLSRMWLGLTRQILYMPMVILFLSSLIVIIYYIVRNTPLNKIFPWSLLCSASLTVALYTREEGIWMMATLLPLLFTSLIFSFIHKRKAYICNLIIIALLPMLVGNYIASMNEQHYGMKITNEMKEQNYSRAWDAMLSLNTQASYYQAGSNFINEEAHLTDETIDKMLTISPLTKQTIEQVIEKETKLFNVFNNVINGTYGLWLLRDAMDLAGFYKNSKVASDTYAALADDIEGFCRQNPNECNPVIISKVQWKQGHWDKLMPTVKFVFNFAALFPDEFLLKKEQFDYIEATPEFSFESAKFLSSYPKFTNESEFLDPKKNYVASVVQFHKSNIWRHINSNFERYNNFFPFVLYISLALCIFLIYRAWRQTDKLAIIATLVAAFSSLCAINIAIALTAYTAVARPVSPATIPVLMFAPIILGFCIEEIKNWRKERLNIKSD